MMTQAFYTGLSGLQTSSYGIDVVSDNLANVNTVGYRGNTYEFSSLFEDALSETSAMSSDSIGLGSRIQATPMTGTTGSYSTTDRSTDLSIADDGWFGIQSGDDISYTRNGAFTFDSDYNLVTSEGEYVLGTMGGNISGEVLTSVNSVTSLGDVNTQEKLRFPETLTYPTQATTEVSFSGNLGDIDSELITFSSAAIDAENNTNTLRLEFVPSTPQPTSGLEWDVTATTQSEDGTTIYDTQFGKAIFDESGILVSSTLTSIDNNGTPLSIDLGNGYDGVVSMPNLETTYSSSTNGMLGGELSGYDINQNGDVVATFTNGMQSSVGKIAVYHFQNDQGLSRVSGTSFAESSNSGEAFFYKNEDGENIIGTQMMNHSLESSNVDMTYGMTELIILQRSYDANSKCITTADEMMQKALDMDA